jgi:hypothetical protein
VDRENDKLAEYKDLNEKHCAGHTNLAYGYALKISQIAMGVGRSIDMPVISNPVLSESL